MFYQIAIKCFQSYLTADRITQEKICIVLEQEIKLTEMWLVYIAATL